MTNSLAKRLRLDKGKGKMELNTSKNAIPEVDLEVIKGIVREVME